MTRHLGRPRDEGTARFIFQAAVGVGMFCIVASLVLGFQGASLGGGLFLLLALLSLVAVFYYGRVYLGIRRQRWSHELEPQDAALEQLFARARADQPPPADLPLAEDDEDA